jgi:hypothetical protein
MIKVHLICQIRGSKFSPTRSQQHIDFKLIKCNEPGDLGQRGRYLNHPIPQGNAIIEFGDGPMKFSEIEKVLNHFPNTIKTLNECGAEKIVLYFNVAYSGQCNLEFSPSFIKIIADLGIPWCVSVYEV